MITASHDFHGNLSEGEREQCHSPVGALRRAKPSTSLKEEEEKASNVPFFPASPQHSAAA